jgi:hypothetical protein
MTKTRLPSAVGEKMGGVTVSAKAEGQTTAMGPLEKLSSPSQAGGLRWGKHPLFEH